MRDHQIETIEQLRAVLKEAQSKLDSRTQMLAYILPHIENQSHNEDYIAFEFCEKFSSHIERFKDEYANEVQQNKDSKL